MDTNPAAAPVPVRLTVCVLPATPPVLSVMVRVPVRVPVAEGLKVTPMVQFPAAARLEPQVLVWEKSLEPALTAMPAMARDAVPVLLRVTGWEALEVPNSWLPKVRLEGTTEAAGAVAVPLKVTVCVAGLALSVRVSVPVTVPALAAVNVTLMVQVPPALMLVPQVLVCV